jgi:hypothetical protein
MKSLEQEIRRNFIKSGLLLGVILTALSIFSFYFITVFTNSPILFVASPLIFSIVIPVIIVIVFCFYGRKKIGGYWNLRQATTGIFIMFLIAYAILTFGRDFVFGKLIEPNMVKKTEAAFIRASSAIREGAGANKKQLDKNVAEIKKNFENQENVSVGKTIQGMGISIIFVFLLALVFGALFKREPPLYLTQTDQQQ